MNNKDFLEVIKQKVEELRRKDLKEKLKNNYYLKNKTKGGKK